MEKLVDFLKKDKIKVSKEGFSLIEVLVAIVILLILVVAFTQLLSLNFSTIFNEGRKSKAIAIAMEKTDKLTAIIWSAENPSESLEQLDECVACEDLLNDNSRLKEWVFCYKQYTGSNPKVVDDKNITGYDIIVVVFCKDGNCHVKLESFIEDAEKND
ncbi:type IV pilus modification PilV family protein [Desulfoscipio gibsoniae]